MKDFKFTEAERDEMETHVFEFAENRSINCVELIDRIESLIQSRADADGSIHPTPSIPTHDGNSVAGVNADISISDLRKIFAHRASRIVEELNQGANQLMTLSDFRTAVADMGWRIGFDQIADKDREILHLNDVIKSAQEEIERLRQTVSELESSIDIRDGFINKPK